jgi:hypothetical protein
MLPAEEPRSIEPRELEVPVEVSLWLLPLWPDVEPELPYEPLPVEEPVPLCPEVEPLEPVPLWP